LLGITCRTEYKKGANSLAPFSLLLFVTAID
jgi:hypothetical protein